ncbi:endo-1,4-beta-xylanase [Fulvivirga ligni]|uniref:endo-1,4-beta-xylanase n=1 Tax=Fulvivirga ligni TaxID=2904246 RepID=UPI001F1E29E1|nr:endo-1,4-beta-xylanase [Fulvivirga ligni]UII19581.1 endo-1,4-beta-xylanase [Fulvivirga ligni]
MINRNKSLIMAFGLLLLLIIVGFDVMKEKEKSTVYLKDALQDKFYIGTALNTDQIMGRDTAAMQVVKHHFNAIVAENCMKSANIQPREGVFNFNFSDRFVAFGEAQNMFINGHTLIWHSQAPKWFFTDQNGNDVSRDVLIQRMKDHITTVVGRYKGRVHTWDVVNEAILDDGSFRRSKFYEIIGEEFISLAFQFAHEADPQARLYYNDYSMSNPGKRAGVVALVKKLMAAGIPIDGVGMQAHIGLDHPSLLDFEQSLQAFADLGVKVSITELDLTVLPSTWKNRGAEVSDQYEYQKQMNPYAEQLPDSISKSFHERYEAFFKLFLKHQQHIERVTLWGVNDGHSWRNNWPVRGRTDYPLLFDRQNHAKPIVLSIIQIANP